MPNTRLTRRSILKGAAAAVGAIGFPYIVPASVLGGQGRIAPSERLTLGFIGVGGMGFNHVRRFTQRPDVQTVAVCDVDRETKTHIPSRDFGWAPSKAFVEQHYAEQNNAADYKGCAAYVDFRELLADPGIDAVVIASPDQWHALQAVAAARAGKDIYCEKALAHTIAEGRAVCEAVKENNRILQTGSNERSNPQGRFACELVRNGRIGKLHTIRVNMPMTDAHHAQVMEWADLPQPEMEVPDGFDYNLWLGPAPFEPYTARRCHVWWRFIFDYGGGEMTDRGAHIIDLAQLGGGFDDTGPVEVKGWGERPSSGIFDTFMGFNFECTYANGVRLIGSNAQPRGIKFEGDRGWLFVHIHGCRLEAEPASILDETIGDDEIQLGRAENHHQNFLEAVRNRTEPFAPAEVGHRTVSVCHLVNHAMLTGLTLKWDPVAEKITNRPEANALLSRKMRPPWTL